MTSTHSDSPTPPNRINTINTAPTETHDAQDKIIETNDTQIPISPTPQTQITQQQIIPTQEQPMKRTELL
ncbi:hypothetical protein PV325_013326 [Microctonus aethiopoides]|nr:hypothetical protein PV325_013326 [Microctonus aethiopoides]